jgi:hypothetical protein
MESEGQIFKKNQEIGLGETKKTKRKNAEWKESGI